MATLRRSDLASEVHKQGIIADVTKWRGEIRDWRRLTCPVVAEQWAELQETAPAPKTPRLYSTHLRSEPEDLQRRQMRLEGLMNAVAVGNLQACEEGSYWTPSAARCRAPLSCAFAPKVHGLRATPARVEVVHDQDTLQLCRSCALRGQRVALVHLVPNGEERALPLRALRDSQLYLRTTYLHGLFEMPRQMHQDPKDVLKDGCIIHTAHVSILRGDMADGAPWVEPVEIEVLSASLQRTPLIAAGSEQYARIKEKAAVTKTIDDIFSSAAEWGIEVLVFPPLGVNGSPGGCYHPPADAGQLLRHAAAAGGDIQVYVAKQHLAPLLGWASFADAVTNGRVAEKRVPPIPLHLSPYYHCYLGKQKPPDIFQFTLRRTRTATPRSVAKEP